MGSPICVARLRITNANGFFDSLNPIPGEEQIRIRATVKRSLRSEPNSAEIEVFNLSPSTTTLITGTVKRLIEFTPEQKAELLAAGASAAPFEETSDNFGLGAVELSWGFMDSAAPDILGALAIGYIGQSSKMRSKREGNDVILTIEAEDGAHLLGSAELLQQAGATSVPWVAKSYRTGTDVADIITDLVNAAGLTIDTDAVRLQIQRALLARGLPAAETKIIGGYNTSGPVKPQLEQFFKAIGLRWSIQNGEILILDQTSIVTGLAPLVLSTEFGNVFGEIEQVDATRLAVSTWADPSAVPGRQVTVITPERAINCRIEEAVTEIDTRSGGQTNLQLDELLTIPGVF